MSVGVALPQPVVTPVGEQSYDRGGGGGGGGGSGGGQSSASAEGLLELEVRWPGEGKPTVQDFTALILACQEVSDLAASVIGEPPAALEVDIIQHPNMKLVLRGPMRLLSAIGGLVMTGTGGAFLLAHLLTFRADTNIERMKSQEEDRRGHLIVAIDEEAEKAIQARLESVRHIKDPKLRLRELGKLRPEAENIGKDMAALPHVEFKKLVEEEKDEK